MKSLEDVNKELLKLSFSVNESSQSIAEFSATITAIRNRYNPVVWFLLHFGLIK